MAVSLDFDDRSASLPPWEGSRSGLDLCVSANRALTGSDLQEPCLLVRNLWTRRNNEIELALPYLSVVACATARGTTLWRVCLEPRGIRVAAGERGRIKKSRDYWRYEIEREGALQRRRERQFVVGAVGAVAARSPFVAAARI
jgi:hypothetical protein